MTLHVAVDIGCIECGEPTHVLGVFSDPISAETIATEHRKRQKADWHGQHYFEVFEVDGVDSKHRVEYADDKPSVSL